MSKSHPHKPKPDLKSQKRQNQADNHRSPIFLPGDRLSVYVGDRSSKETGESRQHRVGEAPYMDTAHTRQPHFALFFQSPQKPPKSRPHHQLIPPQLNHTNSSRQHASIPSHPNNPHPPHTTKSLNLNTLDHYLARESCTGQPNRLPHLWCNNRAASVEDAERRGARRPRNAERVTSSAPAKPVGRKIQRVTCDFSEVHNCELFISANLGHGGFTPSTSHGRVSIHVAKS